MRIFRKYTNPVFLVLFILLMLQVSCTRNSSLIIQEDNKGTISQEASISLDFIFPLDRGNERVTKKAFGLKVSPKNSPVSPEKFSGYHTGVDFEILGGEEDTEVTVKAICSGPLVMKKWATGYGGVAVQKCVLGKETVMVVYGHLKLDSIQSNINAELKAGDQLGILGKGYSSETDNERKHLHLGIHKGSVINIRGYVSTEGELGQWINPLEQLR